MLSRFAIAAIISSRSIAAAQLADDNCPISAAVCALGEPEPLMWIASVSQHRDHRRAPLLDSSARLAGVVLVLRQRVGADVAPKRRGGPALVVVQVQVVEHVAEPADPAVALPPDRDRRVTPMRTVSLFPQNATCAVLRALLTPFADAEPSTVFPSGARARA